MLCVVGCGDQGEKQAAEQVLAHHFEALAHEDYDAALADYDDMFFEDVTRSEWRNTLRMVDDKLGTLQRYELGGQALDSKTSAGPGTYLKFRCNAAYSKHAAKETFYLFRRMGAAKFKILAHEIDSRGFLST
jgi:hypothetical protein